MTYCVAMRLDEGLVFLADSRTNAGVDQISGGSNDDSIDGAWTTDSTEVVGLSRARSDWR